MEILPEPEGEVKKKLVLFGTVFRRQPMSVALPPQKTLQTGTPA